MSHRRKKKEIRKEELKALRKMDEDMTISEVDLKGPEDFHKTLESLLLEGMQNFQCLKCGSREYRTIEGPDSAIELRCLNCGWDLHLCAPVYFGRDTIQ
jgi:predicted RNA-binding Zn-ribbon protein involved in translation (DUF1610 family)